MSAFPASLSSSRYNFVVPIPEGCLLYNSFSGAVIQLTGCDATLTADLLTSKPQEIDKAIFPDGLLADLMAGNFIVPVGFQELDAIRDRFWEARRETPLALTLTTTLDCNLGCYYCYEDRAAVQLDTASATDIVAWTRTRLLESKKRTLHVDWYGGEPLLNQTFIETASILLQQLCLELEVAYSASIISNGTSWPNDVGSFIRRHKIRQAQISFDGMRGNHDQRRRFRDKTRRDSSFDLAAALVDQLLDFVRVDVRINIDRKNESDVLPFIEFAQSRGWFHRNFPAVIQPARLAAYTDSSAFMRKSELSSIEYDEFRAAVRERARGHFAVEESEVPEGFPVPRSSVCAALANDSVVVGADRKLYRCGLQVSEPHRAVGVLHAGQAGPLPILDQDVGRGGGAHREQQAWWNEFDPTRLPSCSRCSFLPICWGGCPKKHLDGDEHALAEQSTYWRRNLARLVAEGVGRRLHAPTEYTESDQFRD
jgi:uncharacterized protein